MNEISTKYQPAEVESRVTARWLEARAFAAFPDDRADRYVIMMPLPNVTGALHMGHAMDNVMQDMLIRWHRMSGHNTLWMAGTDHAGIATQSVVEKRLFELEGKTRHDIGREQLVERIWKWKDQYQQRIVKQQQAMGCSCDWDRQRFTMDAMCARAVRQTFFRMFREGLIYQGNRLVNWDCHLQTAVADDELYKKTVQGHFYHLRYPVIDPGPGEPSHVVVATTRPETMLGDTAVACHAEPAKVLDAALQRARDRLADASARDREGLEAEISALEERRRTLLPLLETIVRMARAGRQVRLPLLDRPLPIITDEWAKPELGSGCVKITPAHDPNDYEVWQRHSSEIGIINLLEPDGKLGAAAGPYQGLDRFVARRRVLADLEANGLVEKIEDREIEIDHSDRSKSIIEPYLSRQWFVRMGDVEGGVVFGRGTPHEFRGPGLAQAAIDAADRDWKSPTGRNVAFHPDQDRYHKIFHSWLVEKRDWCISRQLWWGHRIPVLRATLPAGQLAAVEEVLAAFDPAGVAAWAVEEGEVRRTLQESRAELDPDTPCRVLLCALEPAVDARLLSALQPLGFQQDPDVLDTWFSSALWPQSTLGWPDPETAEINPGQSPVAAGPGRPDTLSYYYPGSCLVTGRDIITLWVARMVLMGLYNLGDVPFTDVFLHANILDGKGERMSKSKGNGIDPLDIIEHFGADAMRFVLCEMQTGTQDIRLPVQAISPFGGELIDLAKARQTDKQGVYKDPQTGQEFDVIGTYAEQGIVPAKAISDRFDVGRNFCNKVWNAARFALLNLEDVAFEVRVLSELPAEDRWVLSRLSHTVAAVQSALEAYNPSMAIGAARDFFWNELCDWYLELTKPRMRDEQQAKLARQVLAHVLDQALRLLQPFIPFLSEELWARLGERAPRRGVDRELEVGPLLVTAAWPRSEAGHRDPALEQQFAFMQQVVTSLREVQARYQVPPSQKVDVVLRPTQDRHQDLEACRHLIQQMANCSSIELDPKAVKPRDAATAVVQGVEAFVLGVIDPEQERAKLGQQRDKLLARIAGIEKKLQNEQFVGRAPADVVEKERTTLVELQTQVKTLEATLENL